MKRFKIYIYYVVIFAFAIESCEKEDSPIVKTDPVIAWENPVDIRYETLLGETQLNATADIEGTFVYTPPIGTQLEVGNNQELSIAFTPTDTVNYDIASKTVYINVISHDPVITWNNSK